MPPFADATTSTSDSTRRSQSDTSFRRSLSISQGTLMLARKLSRSSAAQREASGRGPSSPPTAPPQTSSQQAPFPPNGSSTLPSLHVRVVPHIDNPSRALIFNIVDRELTAGTVFRFGRFAERTPSPDCLSFKSKVISRSHCEMWVAMDGKLYLRDTRSSSGTFLNHVRLSPPSQPSEPVEIHDGDTVQLGVDYQGGLEEVYRCVKMRFELDRARRPRPLSYSMSQMKNLQTLSRVATNHTCSSLDPQSPLQRNAEPLPMRAPQSHTAGNGTKPDEVDECCICLYAMAPFQALFVSPCSHTFHFKCIRSLMDSYPGFQCPICRTYSDLDASVAMEPEEVLEKYGLVCKSFNPIEMDTPSQQPSHSAPTASNTHNAAEEHMTRQESIQVMPVENVPFASHSFALDQEAEPVVSTLIVSSLAISQTEECSPSGARDRRTVLVQDADLSPEPTSQRQPPRRPANLMDKIKMTLFEKRKAPVVQQRPNKRSSKPRPLSYPNFLMRPFSREDTTATTSLPEPPLTASASIPTTSSAGSRSHYHSLSRHPTSPLTGIREETDEGRRRLAIDV